MAKRWYSPPCKCSRVSLYRLSITLSVCSSLSNLRLSSEFVVTSFEPSSATSCLFSGGEDGWISECNTSSSWLSSPEETTLFWYCCSFRESILEGWSPLEIISVCLSELLPVCPACWSAPPGPPVDWKPSVKGSSWERGLLSVSDCLYFWEYLKYCSWWWFKSVGTVPLSEVSLMWSEEGPTRPLYVSHVQGTCLSRTIPITSFCRWKNNKGNIWLGNLPIASLS